MPKSLIVADGLCLILLRYIRWLQELRRINGTTEFERSADLVAGLRCYRPLLSRDPRARQRLWRDEASLPGRRLAHSASAVAPRTPVRCARNERWKDHPAKHHDAAAAHVDREDDRAPANNVPQGKGLANPAIRRWPKLGSGEVGANIRMWVWLKAVWQGAFAQSQALGRP